MLVQVKLIIFRFGAFSFEVQFYCQSKKNFLILKKRCYLAKNLFSIMEDFRDKNSIFSKRVKAGKRTYFFDVRSTKSNDYFLTITESTKKFDDGNYVKSKIFLYKEDFNKFSEALTETIKHVKSELLPEYNYDEFSRKDYDPETGSSN